MAYDVIVVGAASAGGILATRLSEEPSRSVLLLEEMSQFNRGSAKTHSGVWRDLAVHKRRTEAEHQLGPIVSYGQQLRVPTPMTSRLIDLIHEIENGQRPQDVANLDALKALI